MGLIELRERFEAWAKEENLELKKGRLDYESEETYAAWRAWRAALAVAPTPPAQGIIGKIYQYYEWDRWNDCSEAAFRNYKADGMQARVLYIYSDMPPAQEKDDLGIPPGKDIPLPPPQPVPDDETVGYINADGLRAMKEHGANSTAFAICNRKIGGHKNIPLYLRPADDKLRKIAQEILDVADGKGRTDRYPRIIENLRAALEGKS